MNSVEERTIFAKLEAMKDIRAKTIQLEKLKLRIVREVESGDAEEKCLAEYRKEMELLLQEKMSHVEELRQIHADINAMETVIKQAEESRARALSLANRMHEDYVPLKAEVDHMRRDYLGLDRLPELHEEEGTNITPEYVKAWRQSRFANYYSKLHPSPFPPRSMAAPLPLPISDTQSNPQHPHHNPITGHSQLNTTHTPFLAPPPVSALRLVNKQDHQSPQRHAQQSINIAPPSHPPTPTFRSDFCNVNLRQQPPPMKSCLSCHQQIHRNAPICPLCKAKSRSRNPKKPKKKDH